MFSVLVMWKYNKKLLYVVCCFFLAENSRVEVWWDEARNRGKELGLRWARWPVGNSRGPCIYGLLIDMQKKAPSKLPRAVQLHTNPPPKLFVTVTTSLQTVQAGGAKELYPVDCYPHSTLTSLASPIKCPLSVSIGEWLSRW